MTVVPVVCAALAVALLLPPRSRLDAPAAPVAPEVAAPGWLMRYRLVWSLLAGAGGGVFVGGVAAPVAAVVAGVAVWVVIGRAEPPAVRRRREAVRADLPHVVTLFGAALRAGAAPGDAVAIVCRALPGPAADRLDLVASRLRLGGDPVSVWASLAQDPELGRLGRAMRRAHTTGAAVVATVERLADELSRQERGDVEDRARAVGVKAAVPLGLCLLPAFVLIGIVPLVAGLLSSLAW